MPEKTTKEILAELSTMGMPLSQKLLIDLVRRGLVSPPVRRKRQAGGKGSESYWQSGTIVTIEKILKLRHDGVPYAQIEKMVHPETRDRARRVSLTTWMRSSLVEELEEASKKHGVPMTAMLQHGAELLEAAPPTVREAFLDAQELCDAVSTEGPSTDKTFSRWAEMVLRYYRMVDQLMEGHLPEENLSEVEAYLFWRILEDNLLSNHLLEALQIKRYEVIQEGEHLGTLTIFSDGQIRLFKPVESISLDIERCRALAQEHKAVLITGEGRDFNHAVAARALGDIADWVRKEKADGKK